MRRENLAHHIINGDIRRGTREHAFAAQHRLPNDLNHRRGLKAPICQMSQMSQTWAKRKNTRLGHSDPHALTKQAVIWKYSYPNIEFVG